MIITYSNSFAMTGWTTVTAADSLTVEAIDRITATIVHGASNYAVPISDVGNDKIKFIAIIASAYPEVAAPGTPDVTYRWQDITNTPRYLGNHHIYSEGMDVLVDRPKALEAVGAGDGGTKHYLHACLAIPVTPGSFTATDGVENFTDDGDATLTGSAGGTGTIVYATGDVVLDFNANVGLGTPITCGYRTNYESLGDIYFSNAGGTAASDVTITVIVGRDT
jgi:hypothetical protein